MNGENKKDRNNDRKKYNKQTKNKYKKKERQHEKTKEGTTNNEITTGTQKTGKRGRMK